MERADICDAQDHDAIERLQSVLAEQGWLADDTWHDSPLGVGLMTFRRGGDELTVFRDAWCVDIAGPAEAVRDILTALAE